MDIAFNSLTYTHLEVSSWCGISDPTQLAVFGCGALLLLCVRRHAVQVDPQNISDSSIVETTEALVAVLPSTEDSVACMHAPLDPSHSLSSLGGPDHADFCISAPPVCSMQQPLGSRVRNVQGSNSLRKHIRNFLALQSSEPPPVMGIV